jgi:small subunit ribosomal protein S15Ae
MLASRRSRDGLLGCFHLVRSVSAVTVYYFTADCNVAILCGLELCGSTNQTYLFDLQFGYIVLTTSAGIMDHEEARRKNVGGKVLGFFY